MGLILIIDDDPEMCRLLARLFHDHGHEARCAQSGESGLAAAAEQLPDLVLLDLQMQGIDGIETLRRLRRNGRNMPIMMLTGFASIPVAVEAMKLGAADFVTKPFDNRLLLASADRLLCLGHAPPTDSGPPIIGNSPLLRSALALGMRFAVPDVSILLFGETGTGKEIFASKIHAASKRHDGPFVAVDCSSLPEGLFESEMFGHEKGAFTGATSSAVGRFEMAQGGTLFLDEVGNLPRPFQAKLLRVLQERCMERIGGRGSVKLDIRLLSATNIDLREAIAKGTFREDLYFRLNEVTVNLPPLREREGDVALLAHHFLQTCAARCERPMPELSPDALAQLEQYAWPGNVRELRNAIMSAVVLAEERIEPEHLPPEVRGGRLPTPFVLPPTEPELNHLRFEIELGVDLKEFDLKALGAQASEQAERSLLVSLLERRRMSGAQLARMLGIDPKTLRMKLRKYGLSDESLPT